MCDVVVSAERVSVDPEPRVCERRKGDSSGRRRSASRFQYAAVSLCLVMPGRLPSLIAGVGSSSFYWGPSELLGGLEWRLLVVPKPGGLFVLP